MFKRNKKRHIGGAITKTSNTRTGTSYSLLDKSSDRYSRSVSFKNGVYRTTITSKNGDWINRKSKVTNTNKPISPRGGNVKSLKSNGTIKRGRTSKNKTRETTMGEIVVAGYLGCILMFLWAIHHALLFIGVPPETLNAFYNETLVELVK